MVAIPFKGPRSYRWKRDRAYVEHARLKWAAVWVGTLFVGAILAPQIGQSIYNRMHPVVPPAPTSDLSVLIKPPDFTAPLFALLSPETLKIMAEEQAAKQIDTDPDAYWLVTVDAMANSGGVVRFAQYCAAGTVSIGPDAFAFINGETGQPEAHTRLSNSAVNKVRVKSC